MLETVEVRTNDAWEDRRCFSTHSLDHLMKRGFGYWEAMQQEGATERRTGEGSE